MMIFVFTGPTLSAKEALKELSATYLPPVAQGDVYRVAQTRPKAIGIIDGYFERVPAVWHKEILWAMSEGIHVFGSASMGALRAAELAPFGMEGVGRIFEAYRDGILDADDEVAVAHGSREHGYVALSEAMVNIRQTLVHAEETSVITSNTREALEQIAKNLYYPRRTYQRMLQVAMQQAISQRELDAFREWFPTEQVNQKRLDALQMLRIMRDRLDHRDSSKTVMYAFEHTGFWERVMFSAGQMQCAESTSTGEMVNLDILEEELALDPEAYAEAQQGVLLRVFAVEAARRAGTAVAENELLETLEKFRRARDLHEPADVERWLTDQQLGKERLSSLIEDEARVLRSMAWAEPKKHRLLADYLRITGEYGRLLARASRKQAILNKMGLMRADMSSVNLSPEDLVHWYFEQRLGRPTPRDIAHYARTAGFADESAFRCALVREFCYRQKRNAIDNASFTRKSEVTFQDDLGITLPARFPATRLRFEEVIAKRRSFRQFTLGAIRLDVLSKILFCANGIVEPSDKVDDARRTTPSAGPLYSIDLYCFANQIVGLDPGLYLYRPPSHSLYKHGDNGYFNMLTEIVPDLENVKQASAWIVLCVSLERIKRRYRERAYRFALLEAGHVAQNLLLGATAEGVMALPMGGFDEDKLNAVLRMDGCREFAVYAIILGHGQGQDVPSSTGK
jgi:SagB-type dehydrogenase family enzyme